MASSREPLSVTHPELAAQADGWDPTTLTAGSNKKMSWKCEHFHKWYSTVNDRSSGRGCPVCSNKMVLAGYNDLAATNPELAAQADGWDPTTLTAHSGNKVRWRCEKGHTWSASVDNRSKGTGCPVCSGHQVLAGYNDLATTNPELAAQADGWDPTTLKAFSHGKVGWRCEKGHLWGATAADRSSGKGCPVCSGHQVLAGYNDLATTNPELAAQADGWDPTTLTAHSGNKVRWRCEKGHLWDAAIYSRSSGNQCPICANQSVLIGYNDLATTNPKLAAQAFGWDPTTLTAHSNKEVGWRCDHGHTWKSRPNTRSNGIGCPVCSGRQVLAGFNDLATTNPELALQADGWDPTTLTAGSGRKVGWQCEKGHRWRTVLSSRSSGIGCPVCSGRQVLAGFNDLATTNPELALQADGWDPTTITAGSGAKVGWKCNYGHRWKTVLSSRSRGIGCPVCSGRQVLAGFNDLATTNPELALQADGWDPTRVTAGSSKKLGWRCEEGHKWRTKVGHRSAGIGCPSCANSGFDPNKPGWLYLIDHDALNMLQIGISNIPDKRLNTHSKRGWEVLEIRGPMEGHLAQQLETSILHVIEKRGAILGPRAKIEKFDGYSEAWTKNSLEVRSFKELLEMVYSDETIELL